MEEQLQACGGLCWSWKDFGKAGSRGFLQEGPGLAFILPVKQDSNTSESVGFFFFNYFLFSVQRCFCLHLSLCEGAGTPGAAVAVVSCCVGAGN